MAEHLSVEAGPAGRHGVRRHLIAAVLGLGLIAVLMLLLLLGQGLEEQVSPTLEVRNISMAPPPPPPPPPAAVTPPQNDMVLELAVSGAGPALPNLDVPKNIDLGNLDAPDFSMPDVQLTEMAPDFSTFGLNELDQLPTLLTPVSITLPRSLTRQGVKRLSLQLDITIDEKGKLTLNRIIKNDYPQMEPEIRRLIRTSRFSAPTKDQKKVRARFVWPLEIEA